VVALELLFFFFQRKTMCVCRYWLELPFGMQNVTVMATQSFCPASDIMTDPFYALFRQKAHDGFLRSEPQAGRCFSIDQILFPRST
jgi:hypothetical protein